jgi:hypothetical protein
MTPNLPFDAGKTAVLAMDCQNAIVSAYAKPQEAFIERAASVLRIARNAGMAVIHVQVGFRPALPEVSGRNKIFAALKSSPEHQKMFRGEPGQIHPALGPEPTDIVVTKHRVSAFAATDLQMILRAGEVERSSCSASRQAVSCSRRCSRHATATIDSSSSRIAARISTPTSTRLVERLFPRRADVITASAFAEVLNRT